MLKLDGKTQDLISENITKLKDVFPEAFKEGRIDFEALRLILGDEIDTENERYSFTWHGKSEAIKLALKQSTGTLRPCKEESKHWDTTQNLFIEGDNLEVLRILQSSYRNKIKMIYIDPPYNTGNDFIYEDDFKDNVKHYKEKVSEAMKANPETAGRYHTNWLNMMYPRLKLARNLLREDGVIFISIDDNEVHNLRKICDDIFGGGNFVNQFIWKKNSSGKTVSKQFPVNIEYLLMFAKQLDKMTFNVVFKPLSEATIRMYSKDDNDGRGKYRLYPMQKTGSPGPETTYDYIDNSGKIWQCPEKGWRMIKTKMKTLENDGRLCLSNETISEKAYWNERDDEGKVADTLWDDLDEGNIGTGEINKLFTGVIFDYPKPTGLLSRGIKIGTNRDDIILDFFSGSATTAHAVMKLNAEDGGNRKYIMVQIPEKCDEKSEAFKAGYKTIAEIGKERIRRAGEKIKAEMTENDSQQLSLLEDKAVKANLDIGFKVFKLDETNFTQWDEETTDPAAALLRSVQSIKPNRTSEDALYEILLKYGIDLTLPVTEIEIDSKKVFSLAANYLLVCLEKNLSLSTIEEIAKLKPQRVVFYDDAFKDDVVKLNAEQTLRKFGVEDVRVI